MRRASWQLVLRCDFTKASPMLAMHKLRLKVAAVPANAGAVRDTAVPEKRLPGFELTADQGTAVPRSAPTFKAASYESFLQ
jgi:hypothetical protein